MSASIVAAGLAALLLLLAGPGVRLGLWSFRTGFGFLKGVPISACWPVPSR